MPSRGGRALTPSGIILVDKPAGPTSFAIVAAVRRGTGARTGHAGTLDPFATGLLLLLSGASTKLQPRFVGLDKRYRHRDRPRGTYDYRRSAKARSSTSTSHLTPSELEEQVAGLRGVVGLPDSGRIRGEDRRRAGVPAAPPRGGRGDAGTTDDDPRARARGLRGRDCAPGLARLLRDLRPLDRRGARRALPSAPAHRDRPVLRGRGRPGHDAFPPNEALARLA